MLQAILPRSEQDLRRESAIRNLQSSIDGRPSRLGVRGAILTPECLREPCDGDAEHPHSRAIENAAAIRLQKHPLLHPDSRLPHGVANVEAVAGDPSGDDA